METFLPITCAQGYTEHLILGMVRLFSAGKNLRALQKLFQGQGIFRTFCFLW